MRSKDPNSAAKSATAAAASSKEEEEEEDAVAAGAIGVERRVEEELPEAPMVAFVNSRSGGRHGSILKGRLQELIGEEQVFDLLAFEPSEFVRYGLGCLENLADLGDCSAKAVREKLRIMVFIWGIAWVQWWFCHHTIKQGGNWSYLNWELAN